MTRLTHTKMKVFLTVALVSFLAADTQAAVIEVKPVVSAFFDTAFNPLPPQSFYTMPVVVQVDVMMRVLSLAPGEDSFGSAAFSFDFGTCLCTLVPDPDAGGWTPNIFNVDSNGAAPGGTVSIFALNYDAGVDNMDLQGIQVQMANGAFTNAADPRRNVGEVGSSLGVPFLLGSAFLEWSAGQGAGAGIRLDPLQVSAKRTDGSFVSADGIGGEAGLGTGPICPEPSSAVLMGCCLMGMALRRRDG